jgi:hypothetical protein
MTPTSSTSQNKEKNHCSLVNYSQEVNWIFNVWAVLATVGPQAITWLPTSLMLHTFIQSHVVYQCSILHAHTYILHGITCIWHLFHVCILEHLWVQISSVYIIHILSMDVSLNICGHSLWAGGWVTVWTEFLIWVWQFHALGIIVAS